MTGIIFNRKEDEVAVIAPSSGCQNGKEKLHAGINLLEFQGFKCKYDKNILSNDASLDYFASSTARSIGTESLSQSQPPQHASGSCTSKLNPGRLLNLLISNTIFSSISLL